MLVQQSTTPLKGADESNASSPWSEDAGGDSMFVSIRSRVLLVTENWTWKGDLVTVCPALLHKGINCFQSRLANRADPCNVSTSTRPCRVLF